MDQGQRILHDRSPSLPGLADDPSDPAQVRERPSLDKQRASVVHRVRR